MVVRIALDERYFPSGAGKKVIQPYSLHLDGSPGWVRAFGFHPSVIPALRTPAISLDHHRFRAVGVRQRVFQKLGVCNCDFGDIISEYFKWLWYRVEVVDPARRRDW